MRRTFFAMLPLLLLAGGCAETTFQDTLGIGKDAPNENVVRTNPPLAVPPDINLRPPADAAGDTRTDVAATTTPTPALGAPDTATPGAAQGGAAAPAPRRVQGELPPESSFYDIFRKNGISLYKPDGTRKTMAELNRELREKMKEKRRQQNPRYGTIFNIESLWKD